MGIYEFVIIANSKIIILLFIFEVLNKIFFSIYYITPIRKLYANLCIVPTSFTHTHCLYPMFNASIQSLRIIPRRGFYIYAFNYNFKRIRD